jgi:hypothetical protein
MVPPRCGPVRLRKKLVKKEIVCEVPVYKCVVVCGNGCCDCCDPCGFGEEAEPAGAAPMVRATTDVAPLPPVADTLFLKGLKIGR